MAGAQANIQTYFTPLTGSGRTAPVLVQDVTLYDPHLHSQPGRNLLADGPINFASGQYLYQFIPQSSCRHVFALQPRQTKVPDLDERPNQDSIYQVTAVCQSCRIHICVKVDYSAAWKGRPCPNEDHALHHLIRSSYRDNIAHGNLVQSGQDPPHELYSYECSSPTCSAVVTVRLTPEIIQDDAIHTLTDSELLSQRTDEVFASKIGDTEGMRRPSATDVLTDLRTYIRNSWRSEYKSEISVENKRFAVRFGIGGKPCADVLNFLGFVLKPGEVWQVPKPQPENSEVLELPSNVFLDNVEYELSALILSRPEEERQISQDTTSLQPAELQFSRILGCQNYDKSRDSRTQNIDPATRSVAFTILGVPQDMSDDLISDAYDWQCDNHIQSAPHYLSALQSIATQRQSEVLHTKCAIEQSKGKVTYEQMVEAYKSLSLSTNITSDEDHIIGTFESRLQDARNQEPMLRESLRVIGVGLNSRRLTDYAAREITNYEQALAFLDVTADTPDDYVQSMYTLKVTEHASQQDMAIKAITMIAKHRRSDALHSWIASGFSNDMATTMDIGEAYQALEIADRTMDDDTILAVYNMRKTEVTDASRFTRALTAIAQTRNSPLLLSELHMSVSQAPKAALTEPVGLDNIGNTCYLNSLLQFLFTIKQVRDIVLDFDQYRMDTNPESMLIKRVGQRKISPKEVETAQKFVMSLARLFQSMITAPTTAIRPEQELARLTLETDQVKEKIRRRSTLAGGTRPILGTIDNHPIQGPLTPPSDPINGFPEEMPLLSPEPISADETGQNSDEKFYLRATNPDLPELPSDKNSSEETLVSGPGSGLNTPAEFVSPEQQQAIFDNKENLAPVKLDPPKEANLETTGPLRPASPSKINAQAGALANRQGSIENEDTTMQEAPMIYAPPPGPPPIPPRKPVQNSTRTLEEYARQQDVTEVVGHCLFQLSYAIRPTGHDKSGEQQDEIHDLFFGECREHALPAKAALGTPLPFLNIQAAVNNQPRDVYAAIDNYFDISDAGNGKQGYVSITKLPPVLTITLGRVVWDSKTNSQKKLDHHVEMPQTLYMDRYTESEPTSSLMVKREQSWGLKKEILELTDRKTALEQKHAASADIPSLFDDARLCLDYLERELSPDPKFGGPIEFDPQLKNQLGLIAEQKRTELDSVRSMINARTEELTNLFNDLQSHPYRLHAAFFHRGSHGSGHYWVYIIDHKTGVWRKYNDDHVTVVNNLGEIFDKPEATGAWGGSPNPYFLVYVKQGEEHHNLEDLVETLKREPIAIEDEPLGSGSAVARGLMGKSGGRAQSQMAEMPPESSGQEWDRAQSAINLDDYSSWAGESLLEDGSHGGTADGSKTTKVGDWKSFDEDDGKTKW